jgi:predicted unusual protein kinase regulating ubiquinone biosynthesis (AarF/ABC1/UbiB family)
MQLSGTDVRDDDLPTSRLGRLGRLGALAARAGAGRLRAALGGDSAAGVANAAAQALGAMRGLAMKVGQMASYVDGMVPPEHRDLYEAAMRSLRSAASTMPPEAARRVVLAELGAPPEELFADWQERPFASASIGQVHRARHQDGRALAVKIQFEGIADAVRADLGNASLFGALLGPVGTRFGVKEQLAEVRARFLEELDYRHEARRQGEFVRAFDGHARVRIPRVVEELSSARVLTTELAPGLGFEEACGAGEAERRAWAETLWRFVFESLLLHGLFNADPHPGNYLFNPDGVVYFLDFGCTRTLPPEVVAMIARAHRAASSGDVPGLCRAARAMFDIQGESGPMVELTDAYVTRCFEPIWSEGPYEITRDFAASLMDGLRDNAKALLYGSRKDYKPLAPHWVFFNRLQLGFYSVLARLRVAVDYRALDASIVAGGS